MKSLDADAADHDLVITHGNGPQVGMLALEGAHDPAISRPYPFDVLGAQTQARSAKPRGRRRQDRARGSARRA